MTTCDECGVTSLGAYIAETDDGRELCRDCRGAGECERCGRETDETDLTGEFRCPDCQQRRRNQDTTRDAGQEGLGRWSQ